MRRSALREWLAGPADGVMSDMAANATGHRKTDHLRIVGLAELAIDFARDVLAPGGFFVAKVLQGGSEGEVLANLKTRLRRRPARQAEGEPRRQRGALCAGDGLSRQAAQRVGEGARRGRRSAGHSAGAIATMIVRVSTLLICSVAGPAARLKRTLLRTPGQAFWPEKSLDFTRAPS